jgi:hypothetical protein
MIRAKDILEAYHSGFLSSIAYAEVFENPSQSELFALIRKSPYRNVRFYAEAKSRTVYAWDADRSTHTEVWNNLRLHQICSGISLSFLKGGTCSHILEGIAEKKGSKCQMLASHVLGMAADIIRDNYAPEKDRTLCQDFLEDFLSYDWGWVNRYIHVTSYLNALDIPDEVKR